MRIRFGHLKNLLREEILNEQLEMKATSWEEVKKWVPDAYASAQAMNLLHLKPVLLTPAEESPDVINMNGEQWVLNAQTYRSDAQNAYSDLSEPDGEAYEWDPTAGEWFDLMYHS